VSIPEDDWDAEAAPVPSHAVVPVLGADPDAIERFAETLAAATSPAIVVGPQVDGDGAGPDVVALAERLNAAVYVAPWSSRCSFPERHSLFQGFLTASRKEVVRQLDGHGVVLVVGAQIFTYHVHTDGPFLPDGATALHITDNPTHAFSAQVGESVLCSAGIGIRALLDRLPETSRSAPSPYVRPEPPSLTDPMSADAVLYLLAELMPAGAVVVEEAPSSRRAWTARPRSAGHRGRSGRQGDSGRPCRGPA
jgi:benzoylformate decarboxylase